MSGLCTDDLPVIVERLKENDEHAHRTIALVLEILPEWQRPHVAPVLWNLYATAHCQGFNTHALEQMKAPR
jgi:hypothetical protein